MNTANHQEKNNHLTVAAGVDVTAAAAAAVPKPKVCTSCQQEIIANDYVHHTSFGLNLCDDCLYS